MRRLMTSKFLTAEWRYLAMLNYEVEPAILNRYVPPGTELDAWEGRTFVSVVGFLFLHTRVLGVPIPFHRDFEEVNLRFYVGRRAADGWRRGVVFVKEIVPKPAIALVARWVYGENYVALRMRHTWAGRSGGPVASRSFQFDAGSGVPGTVSYGWRFAGAWQELRATLTGQPAYPAPGSEAEFITGHYWGYTKQRGGGSLEYRVEHSPWRVWQAGQSELVCDVARLYGPAFAGSLAGRPSSAFIAEGSPVSVYQGVSLH
jgi:uncharacterized protein